MEEYVKDFNATRAYKAVHGDKMKKESACVAAHSTLRNHKVMTEIDRRITELFAKLDSALMEQLKKDYPQLLKEPQRQ